MGDKKHNFLENITLKIYVRALCILEFVDYIFFITNISPPGRKDLMV